MSKANVFISYSHNDERFADELLKHLKVLERQNVASFWTNRELEAGADWSAEIRNEINKADLAIVLVSPSYLSSDDIQENELPALLRKAEEHRTPLLLISVRPSSWTSVPELAQFQFLNDPSKPLSALADRDEALVHIASRIFDLITQIHTAKSQEQEKEPTAREVTPKPEPKPPDGYIFLSHSKIDGDFAELLKLRLDAEGFRAWVDTDRLTPGVDWRQEIDDSIRSAHAMIAIMSPDARNSEYVTYEWAFAWGSGKRIIPVMLRETSLHPRLATLQYLDFTNRVARPWARLYAVIRSNGA